MNDQDVSVQAAEPVQVQVAAPAAGYSAFWPVTLLLVSFLLIFGAQLWMTIQQHGAMTRQIQQRDEVVQKSQKVQGELKRLAEGLVALAKRDPEAKALVDKYGIVVKP